MYTVVVLAALGGTMDMPDGRRHRGGHGCCGYGGGGYAYGGYSSPYGYASSGMMYTTGQPVMSGYYGPGQVMPTWSDVNRPADTRRDNRGEGVYSDETNRGAVTPDRDRGV